MFNSSIYYFQSTCSASGQFSWIFFSSDAPNLELINIRKLTFGISQIEYTLKLMNNIYNKDMKLELVDTNSIWKKSFPKKCSLTIVHQSYRSVLSV